MSSNRSIARTVLNIASWALTAVGAFIACAILVLLYITLQDMGVHCNTELGRYNSAECKDLGTVSGVLLLALPLPLILTCIKPALALFRKSKAKRNVRNNTYESPLFEGVGLTLG